MVNTADPAGPLLREAMRREYRGKYRLYSTLRSWGWLSRSVTFHAGDLPARVPADEWTYWKYGGPWTYAGPRHDALARIACSQQGNFDAIDLGADVGVVALSLPEMIILRRVLKLRLIVLFVAIVAAGIVLTGYLFNLVI